MCDAGIGAPGVQRPTASVLAAGAAAYELRALSRVVERDPAGQGRTRRHYRAFSCLGVALAHQTSSHTTLRRIQSWSWRTPSVSDAGPGCRM
jgi:hypothetical protein